MHRKTRRSLSFAIIILYYFFRVHHSSTLNFDFMYMFYDETTFNVCALFTHSVTPNQVALITSLCIILEKYSVWLNGIDSRYCRSCCCCPLVSLASCFCLVSVAHFKNPSIESELCAVCTFLPLNNNSILLQIKMEEKVYIYWSSDCSWNIK